MKTCGALQATFVRVAAAAGLVAAGLSACAQGPETMIPVPRDGPWMELHADFLKRAKEGHIDLLFLGDSITQGWGWEQNANEVWKRYYAPRNAANFGAGGDRTQHLLWRIQHGEVDGIAPKVVVLLIGTNNASSGTSEEIAQGIETIVQELRRRRPDSRILLLGIFPRGAKPNAIRDKLDSVNARIAKLDDGSSVRFLDISRAFLDEDEMISPEIMPDSLHLSRKGYRIWAEAMEPLLWSLLDEPQ
jgi:beta-glucosidase